MYSDTDCSEDYIVIPGGSEDGALPYSKDRFCGITLGVCMLPASGGGPCAEKASPVTSRKIISYRGHRPFSYTL